MGPESSLRWAPFWAWGFVASRGGCRIGGLGARTETRSLRFSGVVVSFRSRRRRVQGSRRDVQASQAAAVSSLNRCVARSNSVDQGVDRMPLTLGGLSAERWTERGARDERSIEESAASEREFRRASWVPRGSCLAAHRLSDTGIHRDRSETRSVVNPYLCLCLSCDSFLLE